MEKTKKLLSYFLAKLEDGSTDYREILAEMKVSIRVLSAVPSYMVSDLVAAIIGEEEKEDAE